MLVAFLIAQHAGDQHQRRPVSLDTQDPLTRVQRGATPSWRDLAHDPHTVQVVHAYAVGVVLVLAALREEREAVPLEGARCAAQRRLADAPSDHDLDPAPRAILVTKRLVLARGAIPPAVNEVVRVGDVERER